MGQSISYTCKPILSLIKETVPFIIDSLLNVGLRTLRFLGILVVLAGLAGCGGGGNVGGPGNGGGGGGGSSAAPFALSRTKYVRTDAVTEYFGFINQQWSVYSPLTNRLFVSDPTGNHVMVLDPTLKPELPLWISRVRLAWTTRLIIQKSMLEPSSAMSIPLIRWP